AGRNRVTAPRMLATRSKAVGRWDLCSPGGVRVPPSRTFLRPPPPRGGAKKIVAARHRNQHAGRVRYPLTAFTPQITINNEYSARAHRSGSVSEPNRKEREIPQSRDNRVVENPRNDRTTRLARWFQDRRRSRQKPGLVFIQCRR